MACKGYETHKDRISEAMGCMPDGDVVIYTSSFFDALGDPTRLRILLALMGQELCTCDISVITGLTPSATSHQLRILRDRNIVAYTRRGKNVFYRLEDRHVRDVLTTAVEHVSEKYGREV